MMNPIADAAVSRFDRGEFSAADWRAISAHLHDVRVDRDALLIVHNQVRDALGCTEMGTDIEASARELAAAHANLRALARAALPANWEDDDEIVALATALGMTPGEKP